MNTNIYLFLVFFIISCVLATVLTTEQYMTMMFYLFALIFLYNNEYILLFILVASIYILNSQMLCKKTTNSDYSNLYLLLAIMYIMKNRLYYNPKVIHPASL